MLLCVCVGGGGGVWMHMSGDNVKCYFSGTAHLVAESLIGLEFSKQARLAALPTLGSLSFPTVGTMSICHHALIFLVGSGSCVCRANTLLTELSELRLML